MELHVTRCPPKYCSSHLHVWNDSCVDGRGGQLCGACKSGFSQTIGTAKCLPDIECKDGPWFFVVSAVLLSAAAAAILWSSATPGPSAGAVRILIYFYQVTAVLVGKQKYRACECEGA